MKLCEYDDETLLEEVKHRGFKIEYSHHENDTMIILIGGVRFELTS